MVNQYRLDLEERETAFESGEALTNHIHAVHQDEFDPECPACQELTRRIYGQQSIEGSRASI